MSLPKRNIVANFAGTAWAALLNLVCIPVYVRVLGIEAFGLVGFYAALQAMLNLLDMGLSPTMNRAMARYSVQPENAQEARDLVRTLEVSYWSLALLIGGGIAALAPLIANHWMQSQALAPRTIQQALLIMGLVAACQWPISLYSGGLQGLQQLVLLNGINFVSATLRYLGAALIIGLISPTVTAFFLWQILASLVQTGLVTLFFWRRLPASPNRPRFQAGLLRTIWRFAAGMSGITATVVILTQMDKIILSRLVSLEQFGYYTLAWVVAGAIAMLVAPFFNALFPLFSSLVAVGDVVGVQHLYHRSCQLVSVVVLPAAVVLALFAPEVLQLWTGSPLIAARTHAIVSLLVAGSALNGLMNIPYALQLAHGWTKLAFYTNLVSLVVLVPLLVALVSAYGVAGGAAFWFLLNLSYVMIQLPIMHRRLLPGEQRRWYREDVGWPLAATLGVAGLGRLVIQPLMVPPAMLASLAAVSATALAAAGLAAPEVRRWAWGRLSRLWVVYGV